MAFEYSGIFRVVGKFAPVDIFEILATLFTLADLLKGELHIGAVSLIIEIEDLVFIVIHDVFMLGVFFVGIRVGDDSCDGGGIVIVVDNFVQEVVYHGTGLFIKVAALGELLSCDELMAREPSALPGVAVLRGGRS